MENTENQIEQNNVGLTPDVMAARTVFVPLTTTIGKMFYNYVVQAQLAVTAQNGTVSNDGAATFDTPNYPVYVRQINVEAFIVDTNGGKTRINPNVSTTLDDVTIQITDVSSSNAVFASGLISIWTLRELASYANNLFTGFMFVPNTKIEYAITQKCTNVYTPNSLLVRIIFSGVQVGPRNFKEFAKFFNTLSMQASGVTISN